LPEKRDEIKKILQVEEEEKANIQKDLVILTKRLAEIDDSLSRKYAYTNEYDKTIHEVEAAYSKVCNVYFLSFKNKYLQQLDFYTIIKIFLSIYKL